MTDGPRDPQRRTLFRSILGSLGVGVFAACAPVDVDPGSQPTTSAPAELPATTAPPSTTSSTSTTTTTAPKPLEIEVISRESWNAHPPGAFREHRPVRLTYHHAASASSEPSGAEERIREYQRFHQAEGWPDIAYHFIIDQAGRIYEGRPVDAAGDTFTSYDPTGHFLVCLDGNFDVDLPTDESLEALALVLAWASVRFDIAADSLTGHRDHSPETTCPGDHAYRHRDELVRRIERIVADKRNIRLMMDSAKPTASG